MSITNEDRYNLQQRSNELLGTKEGATLMELLPPVGWADVATKTDLEAQTALLRSEFRADLESSLRQLESKMFTAFLTVIGVLATMAGLLVAVLLRS